MAGVGVGEGENGEGWWSAASLLYSYCIYRHLQIQHIKRARDSCPILFDFFFTGLPDRMDLDSSVWCRQRDVADSQPRGSC